MNKETWQPTLPPQRPQRIEEVKDLPDPSPRRKPSRRSRAFGIFCIAVIVLIMIAGHGTDRPPAAKPAIDNRLTAKEEATFVKFLHENRYICNHVFSSRRLLSEPGVSLYCENWTYDFHQKGGRWGITARKGWGQ